MSNDFKFAIYESVPENGETDNAGEIMIRNITNPYRLPWRCDLMNHSPTGLAWGYVGSGPAQLALALLADATCDDQRALNHYQAYHREVVALLNVGTWKMSRTAVLAWLEAYEGELYGTERQPPESGDPLEPPPAAIPEPPAEPPANRGAGDDPPPANQ